jgi:hypothetical protein
VVAAEVGEVVGVVVAGAVVEVDVVVGVEGAAAEAMATAGTATTAAVVLTVAAEIRWTARRQHIGCNLSPGRC